MFGWEKSLCIHLFLILMYFFLFGIKPGPRDWCVGGLAFWARWCFFFGVLPSSLFYRTPIPTRYPVI